MAATVTLLYAGQSTGSGWSTISGSPTFTLVGGETLVVVQSIFTTGYDAGAPTDSAGTFTKQTGAYLERLASTTNCYGGFFTQANASAGSHTISPANITGGNDGLMGIVKIDGMPSVLNVRYVNKKDVTSSSNTFSFTTDTTPVAGDVVLGIRSHENSAGSTDVITAPSGWTSLWQYLNGTVNLPTDESYKVLTSSGAFTASWTDIDPTIVNTLGSILVLVPISTPTITVQPSDQNVNNGSSATFSVTATSAISYQWQDNSTGSFADIGGATSSSYTTAAAYSMQGRQYLCNVTNGSGTTTSSGATLRVAYNLSGTGLRSFALFGNSFGAGAFNYSRSALLGNNIAEVVTFIETFGAIQTSIKIAIDTATISDTAISISSFASALADSQTIADAIGSGAFINSIVAESTTVSDVALSAVVFLAAALESGSTADAVASSQLTTSAQAEVAAGTDASLGIGSFQAADAEVGTVADAALAQAVSASAGAESVAATEATVGIQAGASNSAVEVLSGADASVSLATLAASSFESGAPAEAIAAASAFLAAGTESGATFDAIAAAQGRTLGQLEFASGVDLAAAAASLASVSTEAVVSVETNGAISSATSVTVENAAASEALAGTQSSVGSSAVSETATPAESALGVGTFGIAQVEVGAISDAEIAAQSGVSFIVEAVTTPADTQSFVASAANAIAESGTPADAIGASSAAIAALAENAALSDVIGVVAALNSALAEVATSSDQLLALRSIADSMAEAGVPAEIQGALIALGALIGESAFAVDSITVFASASAAMAEQSALVDAGLAFLATSFWLGNTEVWLVASRQRDTLVDLRARAVTSDARTRDTKVDDH
jgi:hypothetical protein